MLKNILKLDGAQQLSKNEQKSINGGRAYCNNGAGIYCPEGQCCSNSVRGGTCSFCISL